MKLRDVAEAAGVTIQAVSNWERGKNEISMAHLRALAAFLGIDAASATRGELIPLKETAPLSEVEVVSGPEPLPAGPRDVPVLGQAVGGDSADFTFNGEVIDYVRRAPGIANMRNVFALHVIGSSMEPRYYPGDLAYCGGRPPQPGDDVVIETLPDAENPSGQGFIKRLVRRSGSAIVVEQFNPRQEIQFAAKSIKQLHRVIPWRELLGF